MSKLIALAAALVPFICSPAAAARTPTGTTSAATTTRTALATSHDKVLAADLAKTISWARSQGHRHWGDPTRFTEYARLFVSNGRRWGVDPLLVSCVAFAESRYRVKAPPYYATTCRTVNRASCRNRPGPCAPRWVRECTRAQRNVDEAGMMQVLWYDRSTAECYRACTGKKLDRSGSTRARRRARAHRQLVPPNVAICVGTCELARWKRWAYRGGYGRIPCWSTRHSSHIRPRKTWRWCPTRMTPRKKRNVKFFARHPRLRRYFWVSFYNWGSNNWAGNFYPRFVLGCYARYSRRIRAEIMARSRSNPDGRISTR